MLGFVVHPGSCGRIVSARRSNICRRPQDRFCSVSKKRGTLRRWVCAAVDPYEVLGIPRDADDYAIKKAYRRAALRNHPDVNKAPNAKEKFMLVQEAYVTLSNKSKRASYDRRAASGSSGFSGFGSFDDFVSAANSAASGFGDSAEFAKRWREKNPMPEDINDSIGSIFSDLFSGVSSAVGGAASASPGIFEDFVEFLENQVDGWSGTGRSASGYDSDGSSTDDNLDEILVSGNKEVLKAELDDSNFLLSQLRAREEKLKNDSVAVEEQAKEWAVRAEEARQRLDYGSRDIAESRDRELRGEASRLRTRQKKVNRHINAQERRLQRIKQAISTLDETKQPSSSNVVQRDSEQQRYDVDEELEKLKREMGLK